MGVDTDFVEAKPVDVHGKSSLEDWISNYSEKLIMGSNGLMTKSASTRQTSLVISNRYLANRFTEFQQEVYIGRAWNRGFGSKTGFQPKFLQFRKYSLIISGSLPYRLGGEPKRWAS